MSEKNTHTPFQTKADIFTESEYIMKENQALQLYLTQIVYRDGKLLPGTNNEFGITRPANDHTAMTISMTDLRSSETSRNSLNVLLGEDGNPNNCFFVTKHPRPTGAPTGYYLVTSLKTGEVKILTTVDQGNEQNLVGYTGVQDQTIYHRVNTILKEAARSIVPQCDHDEFTNRVFYTEKNQDISNLLD